MTYQEALQKALTVEWKVGELERELGAYPIEPAHEVFFLKGTPERGYSVMFEVATIAMDKKELAEHIVKLHNESLDGTYVKTWVDIEVVKKKSDRAGNIDRVL